MSRVDADPSRAKGRSRAAGDELTIDLPEAEMVALLALPTPGLADFYVDRDTIRVPRAWWRRLCRRLEPLSDSDTSLHQPRRLVASTMARVRRAASTRGWDR